jgi:hypothetical protein
MVVHGYGDKDIHLVRAIATCNPKLAGAREMATKYIKEPEDMKILGDGVWALSETSWRHNSGDMWCQKERLQENEGPVGRSGNICTGYDPP